MKIEISTTEAARNLGDVDVVLHCAGPFSATARSMLDACARSRTHYLDITGEIDVFEYVHTRDDQWKQASIVALPGIGFDVVPTDCLAAMLKRDLPDADRLVMAFKSKRGKLSPGTTKTVFESIADGCRLRENGELISIPLASRTTTIPFRDGPALSVAISWGDVSTAFHSTGIPNIIVYTAMREKQIRSMRFAGKFCWLMGLRFVQRIAKWRIGKTVVGPTEEERDADASDLYGEVTNASGAKAARTMHTPNGYSLTVDGSLAAVTRLLQGDCPPGAKTPSLAFGAEFVLELAGVDCQVVK